MAVFGTSCSVDFGNEVILGKMWSRGVAFGCRTFRNVVKEVAYPASARKSIGRCVTIKRKNKLSVMMDFSQSHLDSDAPAAAIPVSKEEDETIKGKDFRISEISKVDNDNSGNGNYNNGKGGWGGGGGGSGDDNKGDKEEEEFGPIMKFDEVMKEVESRGVSLPSDMLEAAKGEGIRKLLLLRYLEMQGLGWPLGFLMKSCAMLRNRMLADPSFFFKVGVELVIDSCCATLAEVQKRGKDFWTEFELYLADILVGVGVNFALVALLAPYARFGQPSVSKGFLGRTLHACEALPSSVFEAERPGCRFSVQQRILTFFYKGLMYGAIGFGCGIIGQGLANLIMISKRSIKKSEDEVPVPPLLKSAALWGVFLAVSSNTRYQIINGLERVVESSALAKYIPTVALAFTVGIRFGNNVYAGMQFIDWARWSGVQ
ncbi:protein RETICULATA, chloroplastic-like [Cucurbita pepo subsp. pepo]|uniref:protein RETICULATA, chloroplastic-like n=1 Tax=Cucurbita pepo subsp. pepo TaxID=3664 RepID=UPI000C9D90BD|nr:protein RETICULATA, chloroplastic-like [Cucurbita pepo subsp. pepo]XP_023527109.1 protein RETICULATA, chloroplastic-like [Cucurbita pepo subsp. pepo]